MTNANGHGGKREGAGRKPGYREALHSLPDATALLARGITPIEIMIISMRRDWDRALMAQEAILNKEGRQEAIKKEELDELYRLEATAFNSAERAAPYVHPKLTTTKIEGATDEIANGGVVIPALPYDDRL